MTCSYDNKAAMENIVLQCALAVGNVLFSLIACLHLYSKANMLWN